jgi:DNA polymerase-4
VLPPESRHPDKAWPILCKLLHKACERLRSHGLLTGSITLQLAFLRGASWASETHTAETDSTVALMKLLEKLWRDRPEPRCQLLKVGVVLTRLCEHGNYTPELFQVATDALPALDTEKHQRLDATLDKLRARYGRSVVYYGNVQENRDDAPMRISFTHIPDLEVEQD